MFRWEPVLVLLLVLVPFPFFFAFIGWLIFRRSPIQAAIVILALLLVFHGYNVLR